MGWWLLHVSSLQIEMNPGNQRRCLWSFKAPQTPQDEGIGPGERCKAIGLEAETARAATSNSPDGAY